MPRIRTIKPELWESETVGRMSPLARLLFVGLISLADDEGRGRGELRWLGGRLFPYDHQNTTRRLSGAVQEISDAVLAIFYQTDDGCSYYALPGWREHQRIDKPSKSKLPPPPDVTAQL